MIGNNRKMDRRTFMKLAGAAALGGAGGLMYCAVEPYSLRRATRAIQLKTSSVGKINILHVSDLHIGNRQQMECVGRALVAGLENKPDLICLTGDFINRKLFNAPAYRMLISKLARHAPVFACLGNHDGGRWAGRIGGYPDPGPVADVLSAGGAVVLRNENITLNIKGQRLTLVGLDDLWSGTMDVDRSFRGLSGANQIPRILLAHNPDTKSVLKHQAWDLMLSGHTHGGQVYLPGVGAPVLPVKDRRFTHGLYSWNNRQLYVSSGVGTSHGVRFNCPPEICHLELKGAA